MINDGNNRLHSGVEGNGRGVSTVSADPVSWFAARTGRGQEMSARATLQRLSVEHFIPTREVERTRRGKKVKVEVSLIPNLIFLRATKPYACSLVNSGELNAKLIVDRTTNSLLRVPDKQMDDFIRVVNEAPNPICPSDYEFVPGGKVRVVKGSFAGIQGEVVNMPNKTYLIVSLGHLICAKVQIPRAWLMPID